MRRNRLKKSCRSFCARLPGPLRAIAHRVVHGGSRFDAPVRIDPQVTAALEELSALAPLHNPKALKWITAAREFRGPDVAQIAVFDTVVLFPDATHCRPYAVAPHWADLGVKRYGFHGLAHEALYKRWSALHPRLADGGKVITLQLGGGVLSPPSTADIRWTPAWVSRRSRAWSWPLGPVTWIQRLCPILRSA